MKPFRFQKFTVQQHKEVFRVGTDGVLLGALANVSFAKNILEVGTGSGLISLMIAQRNSDASITALDLNPISAELAQKNFEDSPFHERLKTVETDFKNFTSKEKFDLIISNPPYFENNNSEKDALARQQRELTFEDLISKSAEMLTTTGLFCVIIPFSAGNNFEEICKKHKLFLQRRITIYGIKNSAPKRLILEFGTELKSLKEETFTIEKSPRVYSDQYLQATAEFHVFK